MQVRALSGAPPAALAHQIRHQLRVERSRGTLLMPALFLAGLLFSILGLVPSVATYAEPGASGFTLPLFACFGALFGAGVFRWLRPPRPRPRIVPYFAREIEAVGGGTMTAFMRGRDLFGAFTQLEEVARAAGVAPLSTFGFGYDHYGQDVRWHPAAAGLGTVERLRERLGARAEAGPGLGADLEALAGVLRRAASEGVEFCLVVRLHATESMQDVCTREERQGSFW